MHKISPLCFKRHSFYINIGKKGENFFALWYKCTTFADYELTQTIFSVIRHIVSA